MTFLTFPLDVVPHEIGIKKIGVRGDGHPTTCATWRRRVAPTTLILLP